MNDKQRAKLAMLQAALGVLNAHAERFVRNQALGKAHQQLAALVAGLNPTTERQQRAATPENPAAVKQEVKARLAQRAGDMAAALQALADELGDSTLHAEVDYTSGQLAKHPDNDLLRLAQQIHHRATEHAPALAEQDVTPEELAALAATIQAFEQEQTAPRLAVADSKAQKQAINADLTKAADLLRNRIDKYLIRYQRTEPVFHTAYQSARRTINRAACKPKPDANPLPLG